MVPPSTWHQSNIGRSHWKVVCIFHVILVTHGWDLILKNRPWPHLPQFKVPVVSCLFCFKNPDSYFYFTKASDYIPPGFCFLNFIFNVLKKLALNIDMLLDSGTLWCLMICLPFVFLKIPVQRANIKCLESRLQLIIAKGTIPK